MTIKKLYKLESVVNSVFSVEVRSGSRKRNVVNAKIIFSKIAREYLYGYAEIGNFLGLTHSTIIMHVRSFDTYSTTDKEFTNAYIDCLNMFEDENFDINISGEDRLKKEIISLKRQINSLNSELIMSKANNTSSELLRLLDLFSIVKDRTRVGTEDYVKQKLNSFYNGVYDY